MEAVLSFYERHVLPRLIDLVMRDKAIVRERQQIVPSARGTVVEIGAGSGLNPALYGPDVTRVIAIDPSSPLLGMARRRARRAGVPVSLLLGSGEAIPLADHSVDTIVTTWTLCSIADERRALQEIRRVLRADGRWLFIEHGRAPDAGVRAWQDRLTPLWRRIAGGCRLNVPIRDRVEDGGFSLVSLDASYGKGPKPMSFLYRGVARRDPSMSRCA